MQPKEMFDLAIKDRDFIKAIRIIASVKTLQTRPNLIACCTDSERAFDVLRFVPESRKISAIIDLASQDTRVARLIAEDLPDIVSDAVLFHAINGEEAWADRYKSKFKLTATQIKKFLRSPAKSQTRAKPLSGQHSPSAEQA